MTWTAHTSGPPTAQPYPATQYYVPAQKQNLKPLWITLSAVGGVVVHTGSAAAVEVFYTGMEQDGQTDQAELPAKKMNGTWTICHAADGTLNSWAEENGGVN